MGWYVRTPEQLIEAGFIIGSTDPVYYKEGTPQVIRDMLPLLGKPYDGPEPGMSFEERQQWKGYWWSKHMLIWIPE